LTSANENVSTVLSQAQQNGSGEQPVRALRTIR
jgi:hypothetical protein